MKISLVIEGRPMSKDNEKIFNRKSGRPFTSAKFKRYENIIAWHANSQMNEHGWKMFTTPVFVKMVFYFKNHIRLDLFNSPKSVCDALNGIAWTDDRLIHRGYLEIRISPLERVEIEISNLEDPQEQFSFTNTSPQDIHEFD